MVWFGPNCFLYKIFMDFHADFTSADASRHRMILPPLASRAVLPALGGSAGRLGVPLASVNEAPASLTSLLLALNDGESTRPVSDIFENPAAAAYIAVLWVLFGGLAYLAYGDYQQRQRKSEGLAQMETCALASALPKRTHTLAHACTRMACPAAEHLSSCRAFSSCPLHSSTLPSTRDADAADLREQGKEEEASVMESELRRIKAGERRERRVQKQKASAATVNEREGNRFERRVVKTRGMGEEEEGGNAKRRKPSARRSSRRSKQSKR